jgi:hypothetical protein
LKRARAASASRAVIFAKEKDDVLETESALIDADIIFAYSILSKLNENIEIIGEIVTPSNISFLHDEQGKKIVHDYHMSPPFAAGRVYTSSVLDTLVCQAYYNRHIITILHQLVAGSNEEENVKWTKTMEEHLPNVAEVKDSHLFSICVPGKFHRKTFGELFLHLVGNHIIPLGLRRAVGSGAGEMMNKDPYVYTAPTASTIVYRGDSVFILCDKAPENDSAAEMMAFSGSQTDSMCPGVAPHMGVGAHDDSGHDDAARHDDEEATSEILERLSLDVGIQLSGLSDELKSLMKRVEGIETKLANQSGPSPARSSEASSTISAPPWVASKNSTRGGLGQPTNKGDQSARASEAQPRATESVAGKTTPADAKAPHLRSEASARGRSQFANAGKSFLSDMPDES